MPSEGEFYIYFDRIAEGQVIHSPELSTTWEEISKEIIRVWGGEGIDYIRDWRKSRVGRRFLVEDGDRVILGTPPKPVENIEAGDYL